MTINPESTAALAALVVPLMGALRMVAKKFWADVPSAWRPYALQVVAFAVVVANQQFGLGLPLDVSNWTDAVVQSSVGALMANGAHAAIVQPAKKALR